jgi:ribosomal protein L37AE/L43A
MPKNQESAGEGPANPKAVCFKCERELEVAGNAEGITAWDMPHCGVSFWGGDNYGSQVYDSMCDGIRVNLVVCDDCLAANRAMYREVRTEVHEAGRLGQKSAGNPNLF